MTRNQWLILGVLAVCVLVCISVLSFLLGGFVFQNPSTISPPAIGVSDPAMATVAAIRTSSAVQQTVIKELQKDVTPLAIPTTGLVMIATTTPRLTSTRSPTPTPSIFRLNTPIASQTWEYTVTNIDKSKTITSNLGKRAAQGIFVVVYLTLKNTANQNSQVSPQFEITDANQTHYALDLFTSDFVVSAHGLSNSGTTSYVPGVALPTALVFDVNPSATGLKLHVVSSPLYVSLE